MKEEKMEGRKKVGEDGVRNESVREEKKKEWRN